jgi:hypothetical protein
MTVFLVSKGEPDAKRRSCHDCRYCLAAVNLWCVNRRAIEHRGTALPGVQNCQFWKAAWKVTDFTWWERLWMDYIEFDVEEGIQEN